MPDPSTLALFVASALALLVVPGPVVLDIFAQSVDQGWAAGLVSVLGIHTGTLVYVTAAARPSSYSPSCRSSWTSPRDRLQRRSSSSASSSSSSG